MDSTPISALTHGSALALVLACAFVFAAIVLFFTRRRARYFQAVAVVAAVLTALYWFAVRPSIDGSTRAAQVADPVFISTDEKHKQMDRAGRFGRKVMD